MTDILPPPIDGEPALKPVMPASGKPMATEGESAMGRDAERLSTAPAAPIIDIAQLAFTDASAREKTLPLHFPFDFDGVRHESVRIRRLTTQEVGDVMGGGSRNLDLYQAYSVMTGLPPAVLRGLDAEDGLAVTGVCSGFLPRLLKAAFGFK
ncbi:phage tail assembly protein [Ancylobacter dichloromethanicus]|uniref:Phage tail assembly protein n=1 Tax=Ancylobacter dichloromethanicus TaxID=518825 RepID=A0A9W6JFB4_9HYPH|nr:phage tail assembly protein [Ancylobacter dichloromethanicus]MBS7553726.1 phage tail assembly protein [Ancylobacter dichloromethanicus]GLK74689.1 hypothetical protein GCM10017643_48080 [Ancylobacter dichloromethanicus]